MGGVDGSRRFSIEGGLDRDDFLDDLDGVEKSLVRLFFFFSEVGACGWPYVVTSCSPEPPLANSIVWSVSRSIENLREQRLTEAVQWPYTKATVVLLALKDWWKYFDHPVRPSVDRRFDDARSIAMTRCIL